MRKTMRVVQYLLVPLISLGTVVSAEEGQPPAGEEEIVVTGSYLKRSTADSPSPLSVVDRGDMDAIGAIEIADVVNRMTYNAGAINVSNVFNGSDASTGETNINLRNLGLGSTLVLMNGRRAVKSGTDAGGNSYTSTSTLVPTIALERVEVVKDGASALYGSDAVAGVVNFITRDDFEGVDLMLQASTDQETDEQDDATIAGIAGVTNDRGSLMISAEYLDRSPLTIDDRYDTYGGTGVSTLANPGTFLSSGASSTPYLLGGGAAAGFFNPATGAPRAVAGDIDCELANSKHRQSFRAPTFTTPFAAGLEALGNCTYDFSPFFSVVAEETRLLTLATARYQLTDTVEAYGEFGFADAEYTRKNSLFPLVRFPVLPTTNPGLINDYQRRSVALSSLTGAANPNLIAPAPTTLFGRVLGFTPDTPFALRPVDTDTREQTDNYRTVAGLRGDLSDTWSWDFGFMYNEHDSTQRNTDTKQQQLELAVAGLGGPSCNPLTGLRGSGNDTIPGNGECYYWNPYFSAFFKPDGSPQDATSVVTANDGTGRSLTLMNPQQLYDWMVGEIRSVAKTELTTASLVVTGEMDIGYGQPIGVAIGTQFMRDSIDFEADDESNANNFSFILGAADFEAREDSWAAFIEFGVPIGDNIELQIAGRIEDFEEGDQTTYDPKATLIFRPTDELTLRGSIGTSFRIGSLLQRYGQSTQLINIADPFSGTSLAFRPQIGLGNAGLSPEEAKAWNVGLSWAPAEGVLAGFSLDLDYYDYDYQDLITLEGPVDLVTRDQLSRCPQGLNNANAATFNPALPACGTQGLGNPIISIGPGIPDQVIRDVNLAFLRVQPTYSNAQSLEVDGLDFTLGYEWDWDSVGFFDTFLTGSWARTWDLTRGDGVVIDGVGSRNFGTTIGRSLPEYKVNLGLNWSLNRHAVNVLVRYIDAYDDNQAVQQPTPGTFCLGSCLRALTTGQSGVTATGAGATASSLDTEIESWTVVDLQYTFTLPAFSFQEEGSRISIGGTNVFNEEPPEVNTDGGFDPFVHDPRGAVWYLRYAMSM